MENQEREFDETELDNVFGGYQIKDPEGHPFQETDMYREKQIQMLEEMKKELQALEKTEEKNTGRSR